jgi:hypothetical protein
MISTRTAVYRRSIVATQQIRPSPSPPTALSNNSTNLPVALSSSTIVQSQARSLCLAASPAAVAVRRFARVRGALSYRASPPLSTPFSYRQFSRSSIAMTATKIDGNAIAKDIREKLHTEIDATQKLNPRYRPSLKIIQVGDRSDSSMSCPSIPPSCQD